MSPDPALKPATSLDADRRLRGPSVAVQECLLAALFFALVRFAAISPYAESISGGEPVTITDFFVVFAAATVFIIAALKIFKSAKFVALVFDLAVFLGVSALVAAFFGPTTGMLGGAAALLARYALPRVFVFDAVLLLGMAGVVATIAPGFRAEGLVVILAILSLYDIAAVYLTRHMVMMARKLLQQKAFFAIIVPTRLADWTARLDDVATDAGFSFLGTGDLVLPGLLVSTTAARHGGAAGIFVAVGATLGLMVVNILFLSQRRIAPMPALPPIALGAIVGYFLAIFIG